MLLITLLFILFLLAVNELFLMKKINPAFYWIMVAVLILFAGLRHGVGPDDSAYYNSGYMAITTFSRLGEINFEPGFAFLMYLFRMINLPFWSFCLFISTISISTKAVFFRFAFPKYKYTLLAAYFAMFYYNVEMAQIRLGLSMGICLLASIFIFSPHNKPIPFYACVLTACTIHVTALAFLPAYIIVNNKYRRNIMIALGVVFVILAFTDLNSLLFQLNDKILKSHYLYVKIVEYIDSLPLLNFSLILRLLTLIFCFWQLGNSKDDNPMKMSCLLLYLYGVLLYFGLRQVSIMAIRMASLFRIFEIPLLLWSMEKIQSIDKKSIQIGSYAFLGLIAVYYIATFLSNSVLTTMFFYIPGI